MAAWSLAVLLGMAWLWDYGAAPGYTPVPPDHWPASSQLTRNPRGFTLVLFAHPHCPCTRATLRELERLLSRTDSRLHATIAFLRPTGVGEQWTQSAIWKQAENIPNTRVTVDPEGREARLFGAAVSGHALLFDAQGGRLFSGGITAARGHEGDNRGRSAVERLIFHGPGTPTTTCVYGCPLHPSSPQDMKP